MTDEIETQNYRVRIMVTARVEAEETFEAVDDEAAAKYVAALDPDEFRFTYDGEQGIDGDAIAYWGSEYDDCLELEVVLATDGEPLSWVACNITKELAALFEIPDTILDNETLDKINDLILRAHEACKRKST